MTWKISQEKQKNRDARDAKYARAGLVKERAADAAKREEQRQARLKRKKR